VLAARYVSAAILLVTLACAPVRQACDAEPCVGDFPSRCAPACEVTDCCVPRAGRYECAARERGACPLPNLVVDRERALRGLTLDSVSFTASDCAVVERCVGAPGLRKLLRFPVAVTNTGGADLVLGAPVGPAFRGPTCYGTFQRPEFARFRLRSTSGDVLAEAIKPGACLSDDEPRDGGTYSCDFQGLSAGFSDLYGINVECQWLDVTGIPSGAYRLEIELDSGRQLTEARTNDNLVSLDVTLP